MEKFTPQSKQENISKSENKLESVGNLSTPERVKRLIIEKYHFKSLNDFYKLSLEDRIDILKESLLLVRNSDYHIEDTPSGQWELVCSALGLVEKDIFPDSHEEFKTDEHLNLLTPYENRYKERFRQEAIQRRHWFDKSREDDWGSKLYKELSSKKIKPIDWYILPLVEKRAINDKVFGPIDFKDSSNWSNSIRFGYALIGKSGDGLTGYLKDKFNRSKEDKIEAEEAIYDRRFIEAYMRTFSPIMPRVPVGNEEEKMFDEMNSPDMNATKAKAWMKGMNIEEDLRESIIKSFEKEDQNKKIDI